MKRRVLCGGECNTRIDLLLIYPVLLIFSLVTLVSYALFLRKGARRWTTNPLP